MKPLIGITGPVAGGQVAWICTSLAIRLAGGRPIRILPYDSKENSADCLDGLIISGGTDINPILYNKEGPEERIYDDSRDHMECNLIARMLNEKKPILGICRGAQMINVRLGGNLYQDVSQVYEDFVPVNSLLGKIFYRKRINLVEGTHLFDCMLRKKSYRVNSLHHQAINELGEGLIISATEEYGLVQAIESSDISSQYIIGVQWHPEYLIYKKRVRRVFKDFVSACSQSVYEYSRT